jgi:hypothetical protein
MKQSLPLLKFILWDDGEFLQMWPDKFRTPEDPDIRPDPATRIFQIFQDHLASLPEEEAEKHWQDIHETAQNIRKNKPVHKAIAFAVDCSILRERAAREHMPWPVCLASRFLIGLAKDASPFDVLVGYRLVEAGVVTYCLGPSEREIDSCCRFIEDPFGTEMEMQVVPTGIRPLVYWEGDNQQGWRLFPRPVSQRQRQRHVLCVDHGHHAAFFSSYIDPTRLEVWENDPLKYSDCEVVPTQKESYLSLGNERVLYRNAFVILNEF